MQLPQGTVHWEVIEKPTWFLYRWTGTREFSLIENGKTIGSFSTNSSGNGLITCGQYEFRTHGDLPFEGISGGKIRAVTIYDESTGDSVGDGRVTGNDVGIHVFGENAFTVDQGERTDACILKHAEASNKTTVVLLRTTLDDRMKLVLLGLVLYLGLPSEQFALRIGK